MSGLPAQEIAEDAQANLLAFLDVKLRAGPVARARPSPPPGRRSRWWRAPAAQRRRPARSCARNRHDRPGLKPASSGCAPGVEVQFVPAHLRQPQRGGPAPSPRSRPRSSRSPGVIACSSPRSAMSCMPTQMPRNGVPLGTRIQHRLAQARDRGEPARAVGEGALARAARCGRRAATARGSAVTATRGGRPSRSAASAQRARGRGEVAAAVVDHRDLHARRPAGSDPGAGPAAAPARRPRPRPATTWAKQETAPRQRPAPQVLPEQPEQPTPAPAAAPRAAPAAGMPTPSSTRRTAPARRRSRRDGRTATAGRRSPPPRRTPRAPAPARAPAAGMRGPDPHSAPLVEGMASPTRGSGSTAMRSARAVALKQASATWCAFVPALPSRAA